VKKALPFEGDFPEQTRRTSGTNLAALLLLLPTFVYCVAVLAGNLSSLHCNGRNEIREQEHRAGSMNSLDTNAWFCIRSHPKHEHIAAANLKRLSGVETFCPRLRSRKLTRRGPVWMTESLFPNYLFARFSIATLLDAVKYTSGVSHVVHFANRYPSVPDAAIDELREAFGNEELQLSAEIPSEGDQVIVSNHAFFGMEAVVVRVMPARQRVQVLIDMLGRTTIVELQMGSVFPAAQPLPELLLNA
jgi:transcriptional antiterminator RfaH